MGERDARLERFTPPGKASGAPTEAGGPGTLATEARQQRPRTPASAHKVEAILFDLDNTLVDFLRVKRLASAACARAMVSAGADFGESLDAVGEMLFRHYLRHGIESDDAFETFLRRFQRNKFSYSQNQVDKVLAAGVNAYLRTKDTLLAPYPGAHRTLLTLVRRGYRLGVVTDAPRLKAWQRLWAAGLAELFDVVVTYTDAGASKPGPRGFQAALESLGVPASHAAMVGDWPQRDIVGGNRLGIFTVLAGYGSLGHEDVERPEVTLDPDDDAEPDAVADDIEDLLRIFPGAPAPHPS